MWSFNNVVQVVYDYHSKNSPPRGLKTVHIQARRKTRPYSYPPIHHLQNNDDTVAYPSAHTQVSPFYHGWLDANKSRYFLVRATQPLLMAFPPRHHYWTTTVELFVMHIIATHPSRRVVKPHRHIVEVFLKCFTVCRQQTSPTIICLAIESVQGRNGNQLPPSAKMCQYHYPPGCVYIPVHHSLPSTYSRPSSRAQSRCNHGFLR